MLLARHSKLKLKQSFKYLEIWFIISSIHLSLYPGIFSWLYGTKCQKLVPRFRRVTKSVEPQNNKKGAILDSVENIDESVDFQ